MEMMKREDSEKSPTGRQKRSESKSSRDSKTISDLKDELTSVPRTTIKRRNSTGTIYVDTTMSAQDNQATIRCVCAVIRAHMVEAETERIVPRPQFDTFKDPDFESDERNAETLEEKEEHMAVGSLSPSLSLPLSLSLSLSSLPDPHTHSSSSLLCCLVRCLP
jgi:hypothetical protein